MKYEIAETLDTTDLYCPEPVMMLHGAVRNCKPGEFLKVIATDPSTQRDVPKFCRFLGHNLVDTLVDEANSKFEYIIEIGG